MDQRTIKLMTMHKALHLRDDIEKLYVSRKENGRGRASIKDSDDASIQPLEDYKEKGGERLITATRNNSDKTRTKRTITRKMGKKITLRTFLALINNIYEKKTNKKQKKKKQKTWTCQGKGKLQREIESLLNTIRTNYIKARIRYNSRCRLCCDRDETINHIMSEYSKLA